MSCMRLTATAKRTLLSLWKGAKTCIQAFKQRGSKGCINNLSNQKIWRRDKNIKATTELLLHCCSFCSFVGGWMNLLILQYKSFNYVFSNAYVRYAKRSTWDRQHSSYWMEVLGLTKSIPYKLQFFPSNHPPVRQSLSQMGNRNGQLYSTSSKFRHLTCIACTTSLHFS